MAREIEVAYYNIDKNAIISQLQTLEAKSIGKYHMRRINFQLDRKGSVGDADYYTSWVRIRTDGNKTVLTLKEQYGNKITSRKEYEVSVSDFDNTVRIIYKLLKDPPYDYFESDREMYELEGNKIVIDKFPELPYLLEIEADSEDMINKILKKIKIIGEPDVNKSVPTEEYYKMHNVDYSIVQKGYVNQIAQLFSGGESEK